MKIFALIFAGGEKCLVRNDVSANNEQQQEEEEEKEKEKDGGRDELERKENEWEAYH